MLREQVESRLIEKYWEN